MHRINSTSILTNILQEDPAAILDIKEDIREECAKVAPVTNVVLFDREPDGVASVRFSNAEGARACVRVFISSVLPFLPFLFPWQSYFSP